MSLLWRAIEHYEGALEFFTEENHPEGWAYLHKSLGVACLELGVAEEDEAILRRAIGHYTNALTVFTQEDYPEDWAVCQLNLGVVYAHLPVEDDLANLWKAIEHYENALNVVDPDTNLVNWTRIQRNLGIVYSQLSDLAREPYYLQRAMEFIEQAIQGARMLGDEERVAELYEWLSEAVEQLDRED